MTNKETYLNLAQEYFSPEELKEHLGNYTEGWEEEPTELLTAKDRADLQAYKELLLALPKDWKDKLAELKEWNQTFPLSNAPVVLAELNKVRAEHLSWIKMFPGLTSIQVRQKLDQANKYFLSPHDLQKLKNYDDLLKETKRLLNVEGKLYAANQKIVELSDELYKLQKQNKPVPKPTPAPIKPPSENEIPSRGTGSLDFILN